MTDYVTPTVFASIAIISAYAVFETFRLKHIRGKIETRIMFSITCVLASYIVSLYF